MTCIVGYLDKKNRTTWMGADSCVTEYWINRPLKVGDKIIERTGNIRGGRMLLGICGEDKTATVCRHDLELPQHPANLSTERYMNGPFLNAFRAACKDAGFSRIKHNQESIEAQVLIAYDCNLFMLTEGFSVEEVAVPYNSIGCGESYAMGAMYVIEKSIIPAKEKVRLSVLAACRWDPFVEEPVVIRKLEWPKKRK